MENVKKFLDLIGVPTETITALTSDSLPENFDITAAADAYDSEQAEVFKAKTKPSEEDLKRVVHGRTRKITSDLNRTLGMGLSRGELAEMDLETFFKTVERHVNAIKEEATTGTEEKWRTKADELQAKVVELTNKLDTETEKLTAQVEQERTAAERKIREYQEDIILQRELGKITWAYPERKDLDSQILVQKIKEQYQVQPDGTVLAKDGSKALSADGKRIYKSIDEPLRELVDKFGLERKSNGGQANAPAATNSANAAAGTITSAMEARLIEAQKRTTLQ